MLSQSVIFSALFLALTSCPLFVARRRLTMSHWAWSQLLVLLTAAGAWTAQRALTGGALPFTATMVVAVVVGSIIAAWCSDWSPLAHATFTAVIFTVTTFLAYAGYVLVLAHLAPASFAFGAVLLLLQAAVLVLLVAHTFEILDVVCRHTWRRAFGATDVTGYRPRVSIHVPTHNEPPELVIETLSALARLEYDHYEVLVIDNNTKDDSLWRPLEAHCRRLGDRFRFFHLMPWPGFKSGALNYALTQVATDTEIVAIVDADYLVEPNYLKDLVGHFADPQVGFVQTPQDYRDAAERGRFGRALYLSYQYFFDVSMASRNERNAIIFAGTMGLIRRQALVDAGGWDEWCITEDAEVSFRLLKAGYHSIFVPQTYGRGLMPLDYAGLKKQRFRWAFGGMQLLRMHAAAVFGRGGVGALTVAQRFAYISGGLQWLNDPITFGFTIVLLTAATALAGGGSLYLQPLVGGTVLIPPLLIWFGVMRFLWALRLRSGCSRREALDAFVVLLGLTWVVTLACARGLTARQGVFLRTPKESETPRVRDAARIVWFESALSGLCFAVLGLIAVQHPSAVLSARSVLLAMLAWQGLVYASAARTSLWSYLSYRVPAPAARTPRTHDWTRAALSELRLAGRVLMASALFASLFLVSVLLAPTLERVWQADPLDEFIAAKTLLPPTAESGVARALVREAEAARRQDVETAVALWDRDGVIRDDAFTPDVTDDDQVWRGTAQIRQRYEREFTLRRYRRLRHLNLTVTFNPDDTATIVNDLDALIDTDDGAAQVSLPKSDRWTLRKTPDGWRIVALEVNRAPAQSSTTASHQLVLRSQP
jgi:cellulose synthase/poly-beta-1,6-N-acetylglucosamine synthase-like glycosyltransferase